ncbi:MAG: DUF1837 domain-containing protein [Flavobacteriales bacterium]|nr:DUF1837 domain-containing protein [Flavobacteriales bacterium]
MSRPFKSEKVIEEQISDATLRAYHVGYDQNRFRLQPLANVIAEVIPEFALGHHTGGSIPITEIRKRLLEAARTIYNTDKYSRRGEFGELILHLLLRDFYGSTPLISKIYFKDTANVTVHGFDGVHVVENGAEAKLWLGESKLYDSGKAGVKALAGDIRQHLKEDYLRREFTLISRKVPQDFPERQKWLDLMDGNQKLDTIYRGITIPVVCTYSSDAINKYDSEVPEYFAEFEKECKQLKEEFDNEVTTTDIDIILLLLPVKSKPELVDELHKRLTNMQEI